MNDATDQNALEATQAPEGTQAQAQAENAAPEAASQAGDASEQAPTGEEQVEATSEGLQPPAEHFDVGAFSMMEASYKRVLHAIEHGLEVALRDELASLHLTLLPQVARDYRDHLVAHLDSLIANNAS